MFIVRFKRNDMQAYEEYYYYYEEDPLNHFHLFETDNSGLYEIVEVLHFFENQEHQIAKLRLKD